jgi:perosamine synthetase
MKKFNVPISKPHLTKDDRRELLKCFDSTWISSKGPWVNKFENKFAKTVSGTKYAAAVNSGTSAIFLALKALGIGESDEVIIPTLTMIATVNAVVWAGATPILIDSESKENWNISVSELKKKITNKTKAIIPVHLYGYPCNMEEIGKIARRKKILIIEDAAEAIGSTYKGKKVGSFGDISCFSLYANKIITTGNGGMVVSNNEEYIGKIKKLSFFDFNKEEHFSHKMVAYNLVMTGMQAALGLSQLTRFKEHLSDRKRVFSLWKKYLEQDGLKFLIPSKEQNPNYWFPAGIFSSADKLQSMEKTLNDIGVDSRRFFRPVHMQTVYKDIYKKDSYPIAEYFFERGLLLPSYFGLTEKTIKSISKYVNNQK